ncbi:CLUMA_CG018382, isoform A [Clunio marinus]|uniref:CLUMA_CG018382, isoform A n=1 Tax=Clunio marinus TaxID=568069 RepID=A0A1J1J0X1_9DIPT|nr:CLUMA_CG018382, isoform A [Clunio marinus]
MFVCSKKKLLRNVSSFQTNLVEGFKNSSRIHLHRIFQKRKEHDETFFALKNSHMPKIEKSYSTQRNKIFADLNSINSSNIPFKT